MTVRVPEHDVAVSEVRVPAYVPAGAAQPVDVIVNNPGTYTDTLSLSLTASGGTVTGTPPPMQLAPGESSSVTFMWTSPATVGSFYALTAAVVPVAGETKTADNTFWADATIAALGTPLIVVNSAADPGSGACDTTECTLREAITTSNGTPTTRETIVFSIAPGQSPRIVVQDTALPAIADPVTIDGSVRRQGPPLPGVELSGSDIGGQFAGITIQSGGNSVLGVAVSGFDDGILLNGTGGNVVRATTGDGPDGHERHR
jgi:CSLREA domain-containing protein